MSLDWVAEHLSAEHDEDVRIRNVEKISRQLTEAIASRLRRIEQTYNQAHPGSMVIEKTSPTKLKVENGHTEREVTLEIDVTFGILRIAEGRESNEGFRIYPSLASSESFGVPDVDFFDITIDIPILEEPKLFHHVIDDPIRRLLFDPRISERSSRPYLRRRRMQTTSRTEIAD